MQSKNTMQIECNLCGDSFKSEYIVYLKKTRILCLKEFMYIE